MFHEDNESAVPLRPTQPSLSLLHIAFASHIYTCSFENDPLPLELKIAMIPKPT